MQKTFTQIRELTEAKRRLKATKKIIIEKYFKRNIIENWFNTRSTTAIGYEYDFPHNY